MYRIVPSVPGIPIATATTNTSISLRWLSSAKNNYYNISAYLLSISSDNATFAPVLYDYVAPDDSTSCYTG